MPNRGLFKILDIRLKNWALEWLPYFVFFCAFWLFLIFLRGKGGGWNRLLKFIIWKFIAYSFFAVFKEEMYKISVLLLKKYDWYFPEWRAYRHLDLFFHTEHWNRGNPGETQIPRQALYTNFFYKNVLSPVLRYLWTPLGKIAKSAYVLISPPTQNLR